MKASEIDPNEETELDFWKNKCEEIKEMSEARYQVIGKMGTKINTLTFENRELKAKVEILEKIKGTLNYVIEDQKRKIHALEYLIESIKETIQEFEEEEKEEDEE